MLPSSASLEMVFSCHPPTVSCIQYNTRILVKVTTDELTAVDSAVPVYPNATWYDLHMAFCCMLLYLFHCHYLYFGVVLC